MALHEKQLSRFRSEILRMRTEIEERQKQNDDFDLDQAHYQESLGELSTYDNHPADEGTALYERQKDIALHQHMDYELENIEKALEAMKKGEYGVCLECGKEIPLERLEAIPTTLYCIAHTKDKTIPKNRPVEEEVLSPPFGKFDMDEKRESVGFDAEDSWQAVAEWGTSDSPSDFYNPPLSYNDTYIEHDENIGYVEDFENFVGNDMYGKNVTVYPNSQYDDYVDPLDEEDIMTPFGDLPASEKDPYVEDGQ